MGGEELCVVLFPLLMTPGNFLNLEEDEGEGGKV